jgi:hypothetical protein
MKKSGISQTDYYGLPALLGASVVLGLLGSIALVAAGGWDWFKNFAADSAPAWVQAVGSIAAIVAALGAIKIQHQNQLDRDAEAERQVKRRKLKTVSALLHNTGLVCLDCAESVNDKHTIWDVQLHRIENERSRLLGVPVFDLPDVLLVHIISDVVKRLDLAIRMVRELKDFHSQHSECVKASIAALLEQVSDACFVGVYEIIGLVAAASTEEEKRSGDASAFPDRAKAFKDARALLEKVRLENGYKSFREAVKE